MPCWSRATGPGLEEDQERPQRVTRKHRSQTKHIPQRPGACVSGAPPPSQKRDSEHRRRLGWVPGHGEGKVCLQAGLAPLVTVTSQKKGCVWCWPHQLPSLGPTSSPPLHLLFGLDAGGAP